MEALNDMLYRQLVGAFKRVEVADKGRAMTGSYVADWSGVRPRKKFIIQQWGESYRISCPFCSDTRRRLYVSHRWAETDFDNNDENYHLAKCFNEDCLSTLEKQKKLHAIVYPNGCNGREIGAVQLAPVVMPTTVVVPVVMPAGVPINALAAGHPARVFLEGRGFDLTVLTANHGVLLAGPDETTRPHLLVERIVIPMTALDGSTTGMSATRLAGWQARLIGETPSNARCKYVNSTGMRKSDILYNLPAATASKGPVAVVEGVFDAWKVGTNGVAMLGKTISEGQCGLIARHLPRRPIVVLLDADATENANTVAQEIRRVRRANQDAAPVFVGRLPSGRKDPGECTAGELARITAAAVKKVSDPPKAQAASSHPIERGRS